MDSRAIIARAIAMSETANDVMRAEMFHAGPECHPVEQDVAGVAERALR